MAGQEQNALAGLCGQSLRGSTEPKLVQAGHHPAIRSQPHRRLWEQSKTTSECWCKGQEQCASEVPARRLLLEGGGITQNGAVGTGRLEVRGLWVRMKLYQNLLGGGQNGARLPWVAVAKMQVHRTRQYTGPGAIWNEVGAGGQIGEHEGGFLHWKAQLLQH